MLTINSQKIGINYPPYIIAELSANHDGSIENAKQAIFLAKKNGASAVKIQTYTPDTMTIDSKKKDFKISEGIWAGYSLYDLYKKAYTPFEWHSELFEYAKQQNITIFSSPFDETAIDLLQELDAPAFKIASFELVDLPLIKKAAKSKKPLLISTGMADLNEIKEALNTALKYGNGEVLLFHCISNYPTPIHESQLNNIKFLKNEFGVEIGLSDHTISNLAATVAIALGASAIEKHFKPNNSCNSVDSTFSINPDQLKSLVNDCKDAWQSIGKFGFSRPKSEKQSLKYRRSIYFMESLTAGSLITANNIRAIRPGFGISPKFFNELIGKKVKCNVERGDPVTFDIIED